MLIWNNFIGWLLGVLGGDLSEDRGTDLRRERESCYVPSIAHILTCTNCRSEMIPI